MSIATTVKRIYIVEKLESHSKHNPAEILKEQSLGETWKQFVGGLKLRRMADINADIEAARSPGYEQRTLDGAVQQYYRKSLDLLGEAHTQVHEWQDKCRTLDGRVIEVSRELRNTSDEERKALEARRKSFESERASSRKNAGTIVTGVVNHVQAIVQRQHQEPFVRFPAHFAVYHAAAQTALDQINRLYNNAYGRI
ncbi:MAG: hypothetical protein KJ574_04995 [Nanoarchaeota archaeon]|nr:hypothetical protein [Nanoarchaeota archaeon]